MGKKIVGTIFAALFFAAAATVGGIVVVISTLDNVDPQAIYRLPMIYYFGFMAIVILAGGLLTFLAFSKK